MTFSVTLGSASSPQGGPKGQEHSPERLPAGTGGGSLPRALGCESRAGPRPDPLVPNLGAGLGSFSREATGQPRGLLGHREHSPALGPCSSLGPHFPSLTCLSGSLTSSRDPGAPRWPGRFRRVACSCASRPSPGQLARRPACGRWRLCLGCTAVHLLCAAVGGPVRTAPPATHPRRPPRGSAWPREGPQGGR